MKRLKDVLIKPELAVRGVLKRMDEKGEKTLFIVDTQERLLGVVTDGDIRRWILKGESLTKPVSKAMNDRPVFLRQGYTKEEAKEAMISKVITSLPVISDEKQVVHVIKWLDLFEDRFKIHKSIDTPVVIMAGGEGLRLSPLTNILPKSLIPIGDKPVIEIIMERFAEYGCRDFYLSVNYKANILKAYFNDFLHNYKISYIEEKKPLGTAGSLSLLGSAMKSAFFVANCDTLIDADYSDIIEFHRKNKNEITVVVSMKHYTIPYGICDINDGGALKAIQEKPEYDLLVNAGMYVIEQRMMDMIPMNKFFNITDLINKAIKNDKKIAVYPVSEKSWLDMGEWQELQKTLKKFGVSY